MFFNPALSHEGCSASQEPRRGTDRQTEGRTDDQRGTAASEALIGDVTS